jgi:hypothetical protein
MHSVSRARCRDRKQNLDMELVASNVPGRCCVADFGKVRSYHPGPNHSFESPFEPPRDWQVWRVAEFER